MTVGIVSESSSDIRMSYATTNNIKIVPTIIEINGTVHLEDENFDLDSYYKLFETQKNFLPKSSPATPEKYREAFNELIEADSKEIIVINTSSGLSDNIKNAHEAAKKCLEEHDDVQIEVIDSYNAAYGLVFLMEAAINARNKGKNYEEIIQVVKDKIPKLTNYLFVPTLKYLRAAGRVNVAKYWLARITRKKPITAFNDKGENEVVSTVTNIEKGIEELVNLATNNNTVFPVKIAIVHTRTPKRAELLEELILEKMNSISIRNVIVGVVISANTGPETLGLICEFEDDQKEIEF